MNPHSWAIITLFLTFNLILAERQVLTRFDCGVSTFRCQYLSNTSFYKQLSQRDVSANASINGTLYTGLNVKDTIFGNSFTNDRLTWLDNALNLGYQALEIDLYNYKGLWQLCPGVLPHPSDPSQVYDNLKGNDGTSWTCAANVTVSSLYSSISAYNDRSDIETTRNVILLIFNLHTLDPTGSDQEKYSASSISIEAAGNRGLRLLTPSVQPDLPTSAQFFSLGARVLMTARNISLSSQLDYDISDEQSRMYLNLTEIAPLADNLQLLATSDGYYNCSNNSTKQETIRDITADIWTESSLKRAADCGYSPILGSRADSYESLLDPLNNAFWSWSYQETLLESLSSKSDDGSSSMSCARLTSTGWLVSDCYNEYRSLCRNVTDLTDFTVSESKSAYFEVNCRLGYDFTVPQSPTEQRLALEAMAFAGTTDLWIDWNCLSVAGCWVTGGLSAVCPYHRQYSVDRNGVALLSVAAAVSFLLVCVGLFLMLDKVPFRHHQGKWRRVYNKFTEHEYEGIPA